MVGDALGAAIAAEEHRQGMRHGDDPGHCRQCAESTALMTDQGIVWQYRSDEALLQQPGRPERRDWSGVVFAVAVGIAGLLMLLVGRI